MRATKCANSRDQVARMAASYMGIAARGALIRLLPGGG